MGHIEGLASPAAKRGTSMRKFVTMAFATVALTTISAGAAYALFGQSYLASPTKGVHGLSIHLTHDGRALRPGRAPLFAS
jgi:hypothetical protein